MGKGTIKTKAMTMAVAMSMVAGLCPSTVFAANSEDVAKVQDGTYTGTAECTPDADADFDEYNLSLSVTIKDGKIESITDIVGDGSKKNKSYIEDAADGVVPKIVAINGTDGIDAVSEATCSSKAIVNAVNNALENATKKEEKTVDTTALSHPVPAWHFAQCRLLLLHNKTMYQISDIWSHLRSHFHYVYLLPDRPVYLQSCSLPRSQVYTRYKYRKSQARSLF